MWDPTYREVFYGEVLALQVLDRDSMRDCDHEEPYAVISIADPLTSPPILRKSQARQGVLTLAFSDVDERVARRAIRTDHVVPFSEEMAQEVALFVNSKRELGVRLFVVHCVAGISRSAGIACALSQYYNHDEAFFWAHYRPNPWVRKVTLEALQS